MNDIWSLLGIEPTDDKKAIRKAFAAQSKLHHPEEEPEYFAALNQAYKEALNNGAKAGKSAFPVSPAPDERAEKETDSKEPLLEVGQSSLLQLLDEASEQTIKASMETGALHDFKLLFENPKQSKQADTWKRFFLSESFLEEQYSEQFGKGLLAYLSGQAVCPGDCLPMAFLQELAIAYAFIPHFAEEEYFDGLKYPKEWYKVSVENTFPARKYAAEIFNMQGRECDLKSMTNRILRQPANKVRHNAFSDYLAMKEMGRDGRLTDGEKQVWQHVLGACQPYYLYERNGKQLGGADYESRSECVVKLYVQWLKDEHLPEEVLLFIYKKLNFKDLDRSSTRGLYRALKEEVLRQLPQAEEILFGEDGKEQLITNLYRTYSSIINDNQNNYDKGIYGETPEIKERVKAFFALPEWGRLKGEKGLFERIYGTSKRIVMPRSLAEAMIGHLMQGDFPEPERTELAESLLRSLSTEKMCRELDYRCELSVGSAALASGNLGDSPDFWQYFLMRGFGFRHGRVRGSWEENYIYVMDGQCYLPAYINYIYAPSRAWQRKFVGFDEDKEEIGVPVCAVCPMPGNRRLRVEFHYHYCLYFVDGVQVDGPVLSFSELQGYADSLKKPEDFFFLLAVTAIWEPDRSPAQALIEAWLKQVPVHPLIIPMAARLLAADNGRIFMAIPNVREEASKDTEYNRSVHTGIAERSDMAGTETNIEAVLYSDQERFCFRALVSKNGLSIWRQMDYGWQDIIFRSAKLGWQKCEEYTWEEYDLFDETRNQAEKISPVNMEDDGGLLANAGDGKRLSADKTDTHTPGGRKAAALHVLHSLRQPRPLVRAVYSLEGMDAEQKAEKILESMGYLEHMEGYCVLRYGAKKEKRHDRVFYGVCAPFGFDLKAHSMDYVRSRNYLMSSSNTKIKEPKTLVGRFGWGFKYSPSSDYGPMYVYQGASGKFYAYGAIRMHRAESLVLLLADFFREEWEGVTEVEAYEGCLTVSRLDHRLEYCYTEDDLRQSMASLKDTAADKFTIFGGYGMWKEFARWMDGVLEPELPSWVNVIAVGLDWENGGALAFAGVHDDEGDGYGETEERSYPDFGDVTDGEEPGTAEQDEDGSSLQNNVYLPQTPLLIWAKGMDRRDREELLAAALQWYVDCGKFAEKIRGRNVRVENCY